LKVSRLQPQRRNVLKQASSFVLSSFFPLMLVHVLVEVERVEEVGSSEEVGSWWGKVSLSEAVGLSEEVGRLLRSGVKVLPSRRVLGCTVKAGLGSCYHGECCQGGFWFVPSRRVSSKRVLVLAIKAGTRWCCQDKCRQGVFWVAPSRRVPPRRVLDLAIKAGAGSCRHGRFGFCSQLAEPSRKLMVLGCRYLAGRSGLSLLRAQ